MAQFVGRLTALKVLRVKKPGMYADGAGLYLQVTGNGNERVAKSRIFRFTRRGRAREMGLGSLSTFGLADARPKAAECRRLVYEGVDPIEARRAERAKATLETAKSLTFEECTEQYLAAHRAGWRNAKRAAQWSTTVITYADCLRQRRPKEREQRHERRHQRLAPREIARQGLTPEEHKIGSEDGC
jgi:Arm DNA-binding domain